MEKLLLEGKLAGKELTNSQKKMLKEEKKYTYKEAPKEVHKHIAPELAESYQDLIENKIHENCGYCFCCLYQFCKSFHPRIEKEGFLLGWILFMILYIDFKRYVKNDNCIILFIDFLSKERKEKLQKRPYRFRWKVINKIMFSITGEIKYIDNFLSDKERNRIYKKGSRYLKIVADAVDLKIKTDARIDRLKELSQIYNMPTRQMTEVRTRVGYDANLVKRIHAYIIECYQKGLNPISTRKLLRRFSNKKKGDLFPCLFFLKRIGEILIFKKNRRDKLVLYLGDGKSLRDVLEDTQIDYGLIFDFKNFFKDFIKNSF